MNPNDVMLLFIIYQKQNSNFSIVFGYYCLLLLILL